MDILKTLETDALNVWGTIETDAKKIWDNLEPTIAADLKTVINQLMPVALNLVVGFAQAAFSQWTGGQKAAAVDTALVATAKGQSINLLSQDASMVRQLAYRALGSNPPPGVAAPTPTKLAGK